MGAPLVRDGGHNNVGTSQVVSLAAAAGTSNELPLRESLNAT